MKTYVVTILALLLVGTASQAQPAPSMAGQPQKPGLIFRHVALTGAPQAQARAWEAVGAFFDDQWGVARREAGEALRAQPDMVVPHILLAKLAKKPEERKQHMEAALRAAKSQKLTAWEKAWVQIAELEEQGKTSLALKQYDALVKAAPQEAWFFVMRGSALFGTGIFANIEKAKTDFEKAVAMWPGCRVGWRMLGHALAALGKTKEALNAVARYAELAPNLATPHDTMGQVFLRLRQPKEAEEEFRTALRLDPGFHASRIGLGYALVTRGLVEAAGRKAAASPLVTQGVQEIEMALAKTTEPWIKARAAEILVVSHLILGRPGQAVAVVERHEKWARQVGNPELLAMAQMWSSFVHGVLGVYKHAYMKADEAVATARDPRVSLAIRQHIEVQRGIVKASVLCELGEGLAAEGRLKEIAAAATVSEWARQAIADLRAGAMAFRGEAKKAVPLLMDATEERPLALYYLAKAQLRAKDKGAKSTLERLASATTLDSWVALWRFAALEALRALEKAGEAPEES